MALVVFYHEGESLLFEQGGGVSADPPSFLGGDELAPLDELFGGVHEPRGFDGEARVELMSRERSRTFFACEFGGGLKGVVRFQCDEKLSSLRRPASVGRARIKDDSASDDGSGRSVHICPSEHKSISTKCDQWRAQA